MSTPHFPLSSPDGCCEVRFSVEFDERSGPWGWLQVLSLPSREPLIEFGTRERPPTVHFEPDGLLTLQVLNGWAVPVELHIDIVRRRCRLLPETDDLTMPEAVERLNARRPASASASPRSGRWSSLRDTFSSLAFTAIGAAYAFCGTRTSDRVMGGLCALFFALCTWASVREGWGREPPER